MSTLYNKHNIFNRVYYAYLGLSINCNILFNTYLPLFWQDIDLQHRINNNNIDQSTKKEVTFFCLK